MTTPKPRNDKQMADYIEDTLDGIAESIDEVHGDMLPMVAFGVLTPAQIQLQRAQTGARLCLLEAYALLAAEREKLMPADDDSLLEDAPVSAPAGFMDQRSKVAVIVQPGERHDQAERLLAEKAITVLNKDAPNVKDGYPPLKDGWFGLIIWDFSAIRAEQLLTAAGLPPIEVISGIEVL